MAAQKVHFADPLVTARHDKSPSRDPCRKHGPCAIPGAFPAGEEQQQQQQQPAAAKRTSRVATLQREVDRLVDAISDTVHSGSAGAPLSAAAATDLRELRRELAEAVALLRGSALPGEEVFGSVAATVRYRGASGEGDEENWRERVREEGTAPGCEACGRDEIVLRREMCRRDAEAELELGDERYWLAKELSPGDCWVGGFVDGVFVGNEEDDWIGSEDEEADLGAHGAGLIAQMVKMECITATIVAIG